MPIPLLVISILYLAMRVGRCAVQARRARKGGSTFTILSPTATVVVVRRMLCRARVVRGPRRHEKLVLRGYAFPTRQIPFAVRECTDLRVERPARLWRSPIKGKAETPYFEKQSGAFAGSGTRSRLYARARTARKCRL
jgi:hypothetical protein